MLVNLDRATEEVAAHGPRSTECWAQAGIRISRAGLVPDDNPQENTATLQ